jgi:hypothetical protein
MTFAAIVFRSPSADRGASSDICTSFSTAFQSRERPYMDAHLSKLSFHEGGQDQIATVHPDFCCGLSHCP